MSGFLPSLPAARPSKSKAAPSRRTVPNVNVNRQRRRIPPRKPQQLQEEEDEEDSQDEEDGEKEQPDGEEEGGEEEGDAVETRKRSAVTRERGEDKGGDDTDQAELTPAVATVKETQPVKRARDTASAADKADTTSRSTRSRATRGAVASTTAVTPAAAAASVATRASKRKASVLEEEEGEEEDETEQDTPAEVTRTDATDTAASVIDKQTTLGTGAATAVPGARATRASAAGSTRPGRGAIVPVAAVDRPRPSSRAVVPAPSSPAPASTHGSDTNGTPQKRRRVAAFQPDVTTMKDLIMYRNVGQRMKSTVERQEQRRAAKQNDSMSQLALPNSPAPAGDGSVAGNGDNDDQESNVGTPGTIGKGAGGDDSGGAATGSGGGGSAVVAPQVHVIDGRIVVDDKSLTITAKGEKEAPGSYEYVYENNNYVTSSSYTNRAAPDKWMPADDDAFYKALRKLGTDFSLIEQVLPGRSRRQIKNKFKKEERCNPQKIEDALRAHMTGEG